MHNHELKPIVIGADVTFLNADFKTWSVGRVHGRSTDECSCQILIENGSIISRNRVHWCGVQEMCFC